MTRAEALHTPLRDLPLVALDFETTGSVPGWPVEPWQIGMVRFSVSGSVPEQAFESLLRVGDRPFHASAPGRHHERRGEIATAPMPSDLVHLCLPWWREAPLVAHNASTERRMVRALAPLLPPRHWIDTLKLARRMYPGLRSYALEDLPTALGLEEDVRQSCPGREPHDALYDARACAELLRHMAAQPGFASWTLKDWLSV